MPGSTHLWYFPRSLHQQFKNKIRGESETKALDSERLKWSLKVSVVAVPLTVLLMMIGMTPMIIMRTLGNQPWLHVTTMMAVERFARHWRHPWIPSSGKHAEAAASCSFNLRNRILPVSSLPHLPSRASIHRKWSKAQMRQIALSRERADGKSDAVSKTGSFLVM